MQVRQWIDKNSALIAVIAVVLIGLAMAKIFMSGRSGDELPVRQSSGAAFYMDIQRGVLSQLPDTLPRLPDKTQEGPAIVRAYVFSCQSCRDVDKLKPAYVEAFSPEAITRLNEQGIANYTQLEAEPSAIINELTGVNGRMVRKPKDSKWIDANSDAGRSLIQAETPSKCPDGKPPVSCLTSETPPAPVPQ